MIAVVFLCVMIKENRSDDDEGDGKSRRGRGVESDETRLCVAPERSEDISGNGEVSGKWRKKDASRGREGHLGWKRARSEDGAHALFF